MSFTWAALNGAVITAGDAVGAPTDPTVDGVDTTGAVVIDVAGAAIVADGVATVADAVAADGVATVAADDWKAEPELLMGVGLKNRADTPPLGVTSPAELTDCANANGPAVFRGKTESMIKF